MTHKTGPNGIGTRVLIALALALSAVVLVKVLWLTPRANRSLPDWKLRMTRDVPLRPVFSDKSRFPAETQKQVAEIWNDLLRRDIWEKEETDEIIELALAIPIDYISRDVLIPIEEDSKFIIATGARDAITTRLEYAAPIDEPQRQRLLNFVDSWLESAEGYTRASAITAFFYIGLLDDPYYMGRVEAMEDDPDPWVVATSRRVRRWREQGIGPYKHMLEDKAGQP